MIVVDTNVLLYLHLPYAESSAAVELAQSDAHWTAPPLWRSEFRNALAGYLRRQVISLATAQAVRRRAESFMRGHEVEVDPDEVLRLVAASDCSAYDCEFVAVAERLGVPLVTHDRKILRAFPERAVPLGAG